MIENLIYMVMGGLSMMLFISAYRGVDRIAHYIGYTAIIFLSFYINTIGLGTLVLMVWLNIKYDDETITELIEAFNPVCEIKYICKIYYKKYLTLYLE